ncbi:hypothetical protein F373_gp162 [Bacillus phage SP-10]|uniref:hypothetical protein n=1 Tax=Bacillus phage SP10 TaxID=941058 RepID=UPI0002198B76|nr:hypothetical protein F373_gp162 [Bacillus phage SP-10]BAK52974.1 hypothetical protein [Bacillus phage SP-10]
MAEMQIQPSGGIAFQRTPEEKKLSAEKRRLQQEKEEITKLKDELADKLRQVDSLIDDLKSSRK